MGWANNILVLSNNEQNVVWSEECVRLVVIKRLDRFKLIPLAGSWA